MFGREWWLGNAVTREVSKTAHGFYDAFKAVSLITGVPFLRANSENPHSARGGYQWFKLGLQHYDTHDKEFVSTFEDAKHLTYDDVIRAQNAVAEKIESWEGVPHRSFGSSPSTSQWH